MKAVILCGGLGTRLREQTEFRPKPMVEVGGRPILWHIMKTFAHHGVAEFVLCTGYKGEVVKQYFLDYEAWNNDFTIRLGRSREILFHGRNQESDWLVTVAETGDDTHTGGRVKRVQRYIGNERCLVTYGDGLADIDIGALLAFHQSHGKAATLTTVQPLSRFGLLDLDDDGTVGDFREKPQADGWVNAGFFVFEPRVFDYLTDDCVLEQAPLEALAKDGELMAYRHQGFWQPMDTYREWKLLEELWEAGAPWKVWDG